jgi:hypothetical protein
LLQRNSAASRLVTGEQQNEADCYQGTAEQVRWLPMNSRASLLVTREQQNEADCYQGTAEQVRWLPMNSRASLLACYQGTAEQGCLLQGNIRTSQMDTRNSRLVSGNALCTTDAKQSSNVLRKYFISVSLFFLYVRTAKRNYF